MRKILVASLVLALVCAFGVSGFAKEKERGAELFKAHCAPCHPDGGNLINPQKTLHKKDREANNVKKAEDIIQKMRKPGPGMTPFDEKAISEKDAKAIAEYVLKTFNK